MHGINYVNFIMEQNLYFKFQINSQIATVSDNVARYNPSTLIWP